MSSEARRIDANARWLGIPVRIKMEAVTPKWLIIQHVWEFGKWSSGGMQLHVSDTMLIPFELSLGVVIVED